MYKGISPEFYVLVTEINLMETLNMIRKFLLIAYVDFFFSSF